MNKTNTQILGSRRPYYVRKQRNFFTDEEKTQIVEDFLNSNCTKREIWEKYTGQKEEHGTILRWMREFGYIKDKAVKIRTNFTTNHLALKNKGGTNSGNSEDFENRQLNKRIEDLEKQIKESEMKSVAYSTMWILQKKSLTYRSEKSSIPNHRRNEKELLSHRLSQTVWLVWYNQAGLLSE